MASLLGRGCAPLRTGLRDAVRWPLFCRHGCLLSSQTNTNHLKQRGMAPRLPNACGDLSLSVVRRYCSETEKQSGSSENEGSEKHHDKVLTVPNVLSTFRILLSPYVGYLIVENSFSTAMILFLICGATDSIDGYIARRFPGQQSVLGSVLDPLGDKLMVGIISVCLTYTGLLPWQLVAAFLSKDLFLIGASMVVRYQSLEAPRTFQRFCDVSNSNVQFKPNTLGKLTTFLQIATITSSLAAPVFSLTGHAALTGLWWVTGAATIGSLISYLPGGGFKKLRQR